MLLTRMAMKTTYFCFFSLLSFGCSVESGNENNQPPGLEFQKYSPSDGYSAAYVNWSTGSTLIIKDRQRTTASLYTTELDALRVMFGSDARTAYEPDSELDEALEDGDTTTACPDATEPSIDSETGVNLCLPPGTITKLEYMVAATDPTDTDGGAYAFFALFDDQNTPATANMITSIEDIISRY